MGIRIVLWLLVAVTLAFGSPARISVALKAKQANVDSLMRRKGEDGVAPARAVTLITRILSAAL